VRIYSVKVVNGFIIHVLVSLRKRDSRASGIVPHAERGATDSTACKERFVSAIPLHVLSIPLSFFFG
jgi:hypothetical protein